MGYNTEHPSTLQNNDQVVNGHRKEKGAIDFTPFMDILYFVGYLNTTVLLNEKS